MCNKEQKNKLKSFKSNVSHTYSLYLSNKEHHSAYSKDDIWVLSPENDFKKNFLAKSLYFGPLANGMIEIDALSAKDALNAQFILKGQKGPVNVVGIRLLNASNELCTILNFIQNLATSPLLGSILLDDRVKASLTPFVSFDSKSAFMKLVNDVCAEFSLNDDQKKVLKHSAMSSIGDSNPITLVHGVSMIL